MPHGTPDWGLVGPKDTVFGLDDWGELAVRTWSPVSHDRRGDVIWMDAFEEGRNSWHYGLYGVNAAIQLSSECPLHGAYHVVLVSGTGAVPGLDVLKRLAYPVLGNMGFECALAIPLGIYRVACAIAVYDGTNRRDYQVTYDLAAQTLYYWTDPGGQEQFATNVRVSTTYSCYSIFKMVIDAAAGTYIRFILNEQLFDMRGYLPDEVPDDEAPNMAVVVAVRGDGDTSKDTYLDRVIVTQNEP